jgi:prefoldin subunit 5
MVEATDIEKKSLEAHVELCAERYNALEGKLATLEDKITTVGNMVQQVKETVSKMAEKNNDRLIAWGVGIITVLGSMVVYLVTHYILK